MYCTLPVYTNIYCTNIFSVVCTQFDWACYTVTVTTKKQFLQLIANYHFFMIVPYFFLYSVNNFLKFVKGQLRINLPGHVMINFLYMKMDSNGWY